MVIPGRLEEPGPEFHSRERRDDAQAASLLPSGGYGFRARRYATLRNDACLYEPVSSTGSMPSTARGRMFFFRPAVGARCDIMRLR